MAIKMSEKERHFQESRNTIQEVTGWKMFIFLPQSTIWKFFLAATIIVKCIYNFTRTFYLREPYMFNHVDKGCDFFYFADAVLSLLHYCMRNTRKLRFGNKRHPLLLLIDFVSIMPIETLYTVTVYDNDGKNERLSYSLNLIGIIRIYQLPLNYSSIKNSISKAKIYVIVTVFQVLSYALILTHFLSCFIVFCFNEEENKKCMSEFFLCVLENFMETFYFLGQAFVLPYMTFNLNRCKPLLLADFVVGYIFTYGFVTPMFLFVSIKYLRQYFEYTRKLRHVKVLTGNFIQDKKSKKRILEYFYELWSFGRCDRSSELLNLFPLCFRKNIFCDMHWDAMRHSYLLRDLSMGCKRSLALYMKTEFLLPQTMIFEKNLNPTYFLYLESGLLHIMAEENSEVPVLSLSGGTVWGEMSFFLYRNSQATAYTGKFSIIHTLAFRDFFRVLRDYPHDKKIIFKKVRTRLKLARSMYEIKKSIAISLAYSRSASMSSVRWGNIKWIKNQYRAISDLEEALKLLSLHQYTPDDYERQLLKLNTQLKHTSVFVSYLCVNEGKINKGIVCLKEFPWLMDPQCQFLSIWKWIMYFTALTTLLIYPAYMAWCKKIPTWFFNFSCLISLMNAIDVALQFTTALKFKNYIIQKFSVVAVERLTRFFFIADLTAAVPVQLFKYSPRGDNYSSNPYFVNALAKVYLLIPLFYKLNYTPRPKTFFRTLVKFIVLLLILIYLSACLLYLTAVECVFFDCGQNLWINITNSRSGIEVALLRAVHLGFEIPEEEEFQEVLESYLIAWFFFFFNKHFYYALNGECVATYVLELTYDVEYKGQTHFINVFMGNNKILGRVRQRVTSTMEFQWNYDKNNYITEKDRIWEDLSDALTLEIKRKCVLPYLAKSRLFRGESEDFLLDLCKRVTRLALPAESVLLKLGVQTSRLYIVQKGFVQINSFIAGDLIMNRSRRITAKEGDVFPVVDLLGQINSAISAVTISDCELLVLNLEDFISELMIHGMFVDYVQVIKQTNMTILKTAKLGVSEYKDVFSEGGEPFANAFKPFKVLAGVLGFFLRRKPINSHSVFYLYWELGCVLLIIINVVGWPIAMGCIEAKDAKSTAFKILLAFNIPFYFDFYIRMHVAYYNHLGIYVSHTLSTAVHYLSTAFIADFIAFIPNYHVLASLFSDNPEEIHCQVFVIHMLLRSFALYRVVGYVRFLKTVGNIFYRRKYFYVFFFIGLFVHYYATLMVHLYADHEFSPQFRLTVNNTLILDTAFKEYLNELGLILAFILKSARFLNNHDMFTILYSAVASIIGLSARMWLTAHLILNCTTSTRTLTTYQYYLQSFIHFLTRQKADMKIVNQAIEYFEYEWEKNRGLKLHKIFGFLPEILNEDVMYPLYKRALSGVASLSRANESFYRTLARFAEELICKEGFMITFQKEVQPNIYFIQSGQCVIQKTRQILYVGTIFGDIRRTGLMENTILARTNLKLLRIRSKNFFLALENFHETKLAFNAEAASNEDFIPSIYTEDIQVFPTDREDEECEFITAIEDSESARNLKRKKRRFYIKSDSKLNQILRFLFMLVAYCTVVVIPIFLSIRMFTPMFLGIIYVLDFLWVIKIIVFSRTQGTAEKKRKVGKFQKLMIWAKMFYNIISIIPFEVIPLLNCKSSFTDRCCFITCMFYVNRMFRSIDVFQYFNKKGMRLVVNFCMNVLGLVMLKIALLNFSCAIRIALHEYPMFQAYKCYKSLNNAQKDTLMYSYLCVFNDFIGAGMDICFPSDPPQVFFQLFVAMWSFTLKGFLVSQVMMIIYVTHYNKSVLMVQLEQLEHYLLMRDVSPSLRTGVRTYFTNLLNSFSEGADPTFLISSPLALKTTIAGNIYMPSLKSCYLFRGLEDYFLKQLSARLKLFIFFPGDYIVKEGDVDHNIYFIQTGEVYCIKADEQFPVLEKATELYYSGSSFGAEQGILSAWPHKSTYRAKTLAHVLILNYFEWEDLRVAFPEIFETIYKTLVLQA